MKRFLHLVAFLLLTASTFAQAPNRISYQAVIRNSSNVLVTSASVRIKITILQGSASGTAVYSETHLTTTNANGLVSVEIGGGTNTTGNITTINWAIGPFFIKTETDPSGGTNYTISGTSQLLSVPYALYAGKSGNGLPAGSTKGEMLYWDGTQWMIVIVGLPGQYLQLSSSFVPTWAGPAFANITTDAVTSIIGSTAVSGGTISSDGGASVTVRGVVWNTSSNPTISLSTKTSNGTGIGSFTSNLTGLLPATTYYVRAYATNTAGTVYGNEVSFTTPVTTTLTLQATSLADWKNVAVKGADNVSSHDIDLDAAAWTISGLLTLVRGHLKFNLGSIPPGSTIISAKLSLYSNPTPINGDLVNANSGTNNAMYIKRITSAWDGNTITWQTQPTTTTTGQILIPHTAQATLDLIDLDVTELVTAMFTGGNSYGFMMQLTNESVFNIRQFCSNNHPNTAKRPKLVVTYQ